MKIKSYKYSQGVKNFSPRINSYSELTTIAVESPDVVYIPVKQMKGHLPKVVVTKGDEVKIGSRLAVGGNNVIYSTVSGIVEGVETLPSVYGDNTEVVVVTNNHNNEKETFEVSNPSSLKEDLIKLLKQSSIVDYDGYTLLDKLFALGKETEPKLVINLACDEPYILATSQLLSEKLLECVESVELMTRVSGAKKAIIVLKEDEIKLHSEFLNGFLNDNFSIEIEVVTVPNQYPVGDELELVNTISRSKFKHVGESREQGYLVIDLFTAYATKKLLVDGEVVVARPVSVITKEAGEIKTYCAWVTIGDTIQSALTNLSGLAGVRKLVAGGPMRGIAIGNEKASITFALKGVMAIKDKIFDAEKENPCITCGKCSNVCPVKIVPYEIDECTINRDFNEAVKLGADKCSRCGCCSFVCPSKRFLTQRIYFAKEIIGEKGLKNE